MLQQDQDFGVQKKKKKRCKNYDAPQIQGITFAIFILFFDIEF